MWGNIFGHLKSTVVGLFTGLGTGVVAAAAQFAVNPQTADWKPYAGAAFAAAVPTIVGAFSKDPIQQPALSESAQKAAAAIEQAGADYAAKKADEVIQNLQMQLNTTA